MNDRARRVLLAEAPAGTEMGKLKQADLNRSSKLVSEKVSHTLASYASKHEAMKPQVIFSSKSDALEATAEANLSWSV